MYDQDIFDTFDAMIPGAVAAAGADDVRVRALALETALFGMIPWDQIAPQMQPRTSSAASPIE